MAAEFTSLSVTGGPRSRVNTRSVVHTLTRARSKLKDVLQRFLLISVVATVTSAGWTPLSTAVTLVTPEENEASYLHKLIGYIEWPSTAFAYINSPVVIGVIGSNNMFEILSRMAPQRNPHGRSVEVRLLQAEHQAQGVHVIYVSSSSWSERAHWLNTLQPQPVLVTNAPGGIDEGATIGFVRVGQRVSIVASLPSAQKAGVKLSSRLMVLVQRRVEVQK